jgi:hypothetical protein
MDAQALINRAEIDAERSRIARPSVDATFVPFRREMEAILAKQRGRAQVTPIEAEPHLRRAALERAIWDDIAARHEGTGPAAPRGVTEAVIAIGIGGTALYVCAIVHVISRFWGA